METETRIWSISRMSLLLRWNVLFIPEVGVLHYSLNWSYVFQFPRKSSICAWIDWQIFLLNISIFLFTIIFYEHTFKRLHPWKSGTTSILPNPTKGFGWLYYEGRNTLIKWMSCWMIWQNFAKLFLLICVTILEEMRIKYKASVFYI